MAACPLAPEALPERPPDKNHGNGHQAGGELLLCPQEGGPTDLIRGPSNMTLSLKDVERGPSDRRVRPKDYVNPLPEPLVTS